jgi:hypothetical protein
MSTTPTMREHAARIYLGRGWQSLPIPLGQKAPTIAAWPNFRVSEPELAVHFAGAGNIGVILGEPSGDLVDVDIDRVGVIDLAESWLPPTQHIFGRPGKPTSHRLYVAPSARTAKFVDPVGDEMLVELRSNGCQTILPPSQHPTGEIVAWEQHGEAATISAADLSAACGKFAAAILVRKYLTHREAEILQQPPEAWTAALGSTDPKLERAARRWLALPFVNGRHQHNESHSRVAAAGHPYVAAAFEYEIAEVRSTGKGSRNDRLNVAAFSLARWIPSGALTEREIETALLDAARANGLVADKGEQSCIATIRSGIRGGLQAVPREVPANEPRRHLGDRSTEGADTAERPKRRLVALTAGDLLTMDIPAREMLLDPVLPAKGTVMIHSKRGVGKTFIGLSIAYAVASGGKCLRWEAPKARRVLVIDGEMPLVTLKERLARIADSSEQEPPSADYIRIIAADHQEYGIPDLASPEGMAAIEEHLEGIELVIVDNLSTLCRFGKENEGESWAPIQEWALSLRRRGISVLFIHHSGKGGTQRGTSKREDVLDSVIVLRHPDDYSPTDGARFEVHLEKGRGIYGEKAKPFEAKLEIIDDKMVWTMRDLEDAEARRAADLKADGFSIREIGQEMGTSKSRVERLLKKAAEKKAEE